MIQNVKKLGTKLRVEPICNCLDVVVLENRKVKVQKARPDERISAEIPAQGDWIRNGEALGFDVVDCPRIDQRTAAWSANEIGNIDVWVGAIYPEGVSAKTSGKRHAGARREDPSKLPSADCPACHPGCPFRRIDLPVVIDLEIVGNIEIRQPTIQLGDKPEWAGNGI